MTITTVNTLSHFCHLFVNNAHLCYCLVMNQACKQLCYVTVSIKVIISQVYAYSATLYLDCSKVQSPHAVQLMRPVIVQNTSCTVGDFA